MTILTPPWHPRHQHQFSINFWVGTLSDQLLRPVVLSNRITSAVYHCFLVNGYQYSWNMCLFINDNICESNMMGRYLIFSALSGSTWTRLWWTRHGGPVNWPARHSDLNPVDWWLWGHLRLWRIQCWSMTGGITAMSEDPSESRNFW
jgi:hypothetical protein